MIGRYWRKIESVENNIKNSIQISSILLKLKEYDEKLGDLSKIGNNENNISSNLDKIGNNENNISSNLGIINTNKNDISSNLGKISDNNTNISSNLNQINNIKSILPTLEIFKKNMVLKTNHLNLIVI